MVATRIGGTVSWVTVLTAGFVFAAFGFLGSYRYVENFWLYRGFPRPEDPAFVRTPGRAVTITVESAALGGRQQEVDVYLPPGYAKDRGRRYPVLYLLHGEPGRPGAFLSTVRMGVVEDELTTLRRAQPLILVMPFGSTGTFTDTEWANGVGANQGWETFVAHDVVRAIDARYRTVRASWGRGIGGLSEGGYGAVNIALHHPGEFGLVESWSGYMRADPIESIFGRSATQLRRNSPLETVGAAAAALRRAHTFFWFYSGRDDPYLPQNEAFAARLSRLGLAHRFFVVAGGHNWALWRGNAADAYLAASRHLDAIDAT